MVAHKMRCINLLYLLIVSIVINAKYSSGKAVAVNIMKNYLEQIDKMIDKTDALRKHYWKKNLSTHPSSSLLQRLHYKELQLSSKDASKLSNYLLTLEDFLSAFDLIKMQDSNITDLRIGVQNVKKQLDTIIDRNKIAVDKSLKPRFNKTNVLKITEKHLKRINADRKVFQRNLLIHAFTNQFSIFLRRFREYLDNLDKRFGTKIYVRKR